MDNKSQNGHWRKSGTSRSSAASQRWQPRGRRPVSAARWLKWFAAWTERSRRMVLPWRSPAMSLVQPIAFVQRLRERRLLCALHLCPRVDLAIHPILIENNMRTSILKELAVFPFAPPLSKEVLKRQSGRPLPGDSRVDPYRPFGMKITAAQESVPVSQGNSVGRPEALAFTPLSLVLQRMSTPMSLVANPDGVAGSRRMNVVADQVLKRLQRSEQYVGRPNLIPPRPQPRIVTAEPASATAVAQAPELLETVPARARWKQAPAQTAPINVEALTDQVLQRIDRRVVAWRERTGRR